MRTTHGFAFAIFLSSSFFSHPAAAVESLPLTIPTRFHSSSIVPPVHYEHTPPQNVSSAHLSTFIGIRGASSIELGNAGPYILDEQGEVIWSGGTKSVLNFGRHLYKGEPVLAFYTGSSFRIFLFFCFR
jgi:hypothetical protein